MKNPEDKYCPLLKRFPTRCLNPKPLDGLPPDRGVRREIDLKPGSGYCVLRQWPLWKEQSDIIDAFFDKKQQAGLVRESKSPHSAPTFCVRKPNDKWRIVHAYNKLNAATVPAQTPTPRKDVILHRMAGSKKFSVLDLVDGYYQRLSNAPATFNYQVGALFRPLRDFAQTYFDDIFVHTKPSLQEAPILALPDDAPPFSVVCDASEYDIGCALLHEDEHGRERVISFQSRQLKGAERNYPVHDKLLAMKFVLLRAHLHRYHERDGLLYYSGVVGEDPRVVVPSSEDLKHRIVFETHDTPVAGRLGRDKTFAQLSQTFWWPKMYKWVGTMDFIFGFPRDPHGNTGILVFVDRLSKMVHLAAVPDTVDAETTASLFLDTVFRHHGMPVSIVSDR
ncbi:hypothetical protein ATCC90586_007490 [Pythium insidiosum]|nr:hypothetical protein ATCC90586_007490 [Pythium insidiosum]